MNDVFRAFICLVGKEGIDWLSHLKDSDCWELYLIIHQN